MTQTVLDVRIKRQPDDTTCGPTCLHAVYAYHGDRISLDEVIATTASLAGTTAERGTLAVMLGLHALHRGYRATLHTFNLQVFDPSWFDRETGESDPAHLTRKLIQQDAHKGDADPKLRLATSAYIDFLARGGRIAFGDLTTGLLTRQIRAGRPILTGLSATYLYRAEREYGPDDDEDDVRGNPAGHFVVLHGYDSNRRLVRIADPLEDNPAFRAREYDVPMARLVPAIMLGVLTYDANLLVIEPDAQTHNDKGAP